ncbi:response regulator [Pelomonas sp. APW6]|uniref:Response regulator n=1 Tax=Roseateles subflavus TaxID=3053353 RepID=A0ABT7LCB2_9BURK|nr:response regulator [Pelomonas sp. APW6]MDL5030496.1 response regulator [Pelomonas sp. APW6]
MPFQLPDLLGPYLLPLLIAVPLAIVVILISIRKEDEEVRQFQESQLPAPFSGPGAASRFQPSVLPGMGQGVGTVTGPVPVLVVDDSAVVRAKLGKLLEGAGYLVLLARDGIEALEVLARHPVQVMITDLEMPNKNGFELIADVQGALETEDLPIIAITGHEELQGRVHQIQGLYGIFKKPWSDRDLLKRIETLTQLRQRGPRIAA